MTDSEDLPDAQARITPRLIDSFYTQAMLLADEARSYFDEAGHSDRELLDPFTRVTFACESLKVTTRVMHIVAWLLSSEPSKAAKSNMPRGAGPNGGSAMRRTANRR